ncbi:hypothetical protein TUMSATVNIG1_61230 (plasmid) [Vibrio nigripulchritudo]|nr:dATP/dGTP pyrophosphohydrolase domain-containing protein [Vibrio nigripulchritudo]BCL74139.1 hypothetical protein VNTUMSATTG_60760 [Vibrio nigripulchritudo]BDU35514.1 hypothetical protein TUMSATVNIG1_61230 [Vibrio nigripulchritudo]
MVRESKDYPGDAYEWADCFILAVDGDMRAGGSARKIGESLIVNLSAAQEVPVYQGIGWEELEEQLSAMQDSIADSNWKDWVNFARMILVLAKDNNYALAGASAFV